MGNLAADLAGIDLTALERAPRPVLERATLLLREIDRRDRMRRFDHLFPDVTHEWRGEVYWARDHYGPHLEFIGATADYRETAMMAANRVGKTVVGGFALTVWLTGRYPDWWPGCRFPGPIRAWAAGKTNQTTRDIVQSTLLGEITWSGSRRRVAGTGIIPGEALGTATWRTGIPDALDTIKVRHESGGWSTLGFKSYEQGRGSFEGTAQHAIWCDEEPPQDVYTEALTRTATTNGRVISTFTPLEGMSDVAMRFLPGMGDNA